MKTNFMKIIGLALMVLFVMAASPVLMAQAAVTSQTATMPDDITGMFSSLGALAGVVLVVTSFLKVQLKSSNTLTIIISGVVSLTLAYLGFILQLGIFVGLAWWYFLVYGFAAMVVANGFSTWPVISNLLTFLKLKLPKE